MFTFGWYEPMFDDPDFADRYWARWRELLDDTLGDDHVLAIVDEMAAELEEAAPRNFERWDDYGPRGGSFEAEVELLKEWLVTRRAWIEACMDDHPDDPRQCGGL
jgi:hypothetical protein